MFVKMGPDDESSDDNDYNGKTDDAHGSGVAEVVTAMQCFERFDSVVSLLVHNDDYTCDDLYRWDVFCETDQIQCVL